MNQVINKIDNAKSHSPKHFFVLTDNMYYKHTSPMLKKSFLNKSICNINVLRNDTSLLVYKDKTKLKNYMEAIELNQSIKWTDFNFDIQEWSLDDCLTYCYYSNLTFKIK